jgi:hypothetical protein
MTIDRNKRNFIDNEAVELVGLLESVNSSKFHRPQKIAGSLAERPTAQTFRMNEPYVMSNGLSIYECEASQCFGFEGENYMRLRRLITTTHKTPDIDYSVSREFLGKTIFRWIINKKKGTEKQSFSDFVLAQCTGSMKELHFYFPIAYVDFEVPFDIGRVGFAYLNDKFFDRYVEYAKSNSVPPERYEEVRKDWKGRPVAMLSVYAEQTRAQEIALRECALAVDVLKICTDTLDNPLFPADFDIDCRIIHAEQNEVLTENPNDLGELMVVLERPHNDAHQIIGKGQLDKYAQARSLKVFHDFICNLTRQRTEIQNLIVRGIGRFAAALTIRDLHQRTTRLFTILESLILLNEDQPIIDRVSNYASKLASKSPAERTEIISILKRMYGVRSKYIHHAKEEAIDPTDLVMVQRVVHALLVAFIGKSATHKQKETILKEIDDAILGAY